MKVGQKKHESKVGRMLAMPATRQCISGMNLLRQLYLLQPTGTEAADQTFYLTQSQYADTGSTSPNADPIMPGAWQGSHWRDYSRVTGMPSPGKSWAAKAGFEPISAALVPDPLP